jgi:Tfp pilus assembly protein PilX
MNSMQDNKDPRKCSTLKQVFEDEEGMVLILVLIILLAAIIIGVTTMRSSSLEARIAGNERRFTENFNNLESAVTYVFNIDNANALIAVSDSIGLSYTYPTTPVNSFLPTHDQTINVTLTLSAIKKPPVGSGNDPSMKARYYTIQATDSADNQSVTVGAYKVFPQSSN